jgi:hypothetical protein
MRVVSRDVHAATAAQHHARRAGARPGGAHEPVGCIANDTTPAAVVRIALIGNAASVAIHLPRRARARTGRAGRPAPAHGPAGATVHIVAARVDARPLAIRELPTGFAQSALSHACAAGAEPFGRARRDRLARAVISACSAIGEIGREGHALASAWGLAGGTGAFAVRTLLATRAGNAARAAVGGVRLQGDASVAAVGQRRAGVGSAV